MTARQTAALPQVTAARQGGIGRITFTNPAHFNAMTLAMWRTLPSLLADFAADPAIRCVVLRGAGDKAFVSGADISEFARERADAEGIARYNATVDAANQALKTFAKPTVAMIRGFCLGGGLGLALCCDLRVAAADASFAVPAAKLGLGYGYAGVKQLADLVGPAFAKEIFYTGRRFSAEEAGAMGLVNRVVPVAALAATVDALSATIAGNAPLTLAAAKQCVAAWAKGPDADDLARCAEMVDRCFTSADYAEGRRAFAEKRTPRFQGR
jgi:enoyl-CoA hydratase/carnithine racemase